MRIFAYMRFSSENQTGNTSVDTQRDAIRRFVEASGDLRGVPIVECIDEAKSATTLAGREALALIRQQAVKGDAVIVFKLDRLGRNLLDSLQVLKDFEDRGCKVYSTCESNEPVVRHIMLAMAEEQSRALGDRCKRALQKRVASGNVANRAPYGYRIERAAKNAPGKLVPVAEQAGIVKQMFEWRADGRSHREIAGLLNAQAIPSATGGIWSMGCIRAILHNQTYVGTLITGMRRFKKGHGLQEIRPKEEWTITENAHEPIVTKEIWEAVRLKDGKNQEAGRVRSGKTQYLWSGLLKCGVCGANLTRQQSKRIIYYGCQDGRKSGMKKPCQCRCLVREDAITSVVTTLIVDRIGNWAGSVIQEFKRQVLAARGALGADDQRDLENVEKLTQRIQTAERRIIHVPEDSLPTVLAEIARLKEERSKIQVKLAASAGVMTTTTLDELEKKALNWLSNLPALLVANDALTARNLLSTLIARVNIWPDKKAQLVLKPGFLMSMGQEHIPTGI